ncbi:MAG TPA: hypothetical protein VLA75_03020 [Thermoanaerobaculia bacterium]|nr:hypothetical protein [Thermoanaerobaculia bacterium]
MVLGLAPGEIGLSPESYPGKVWGVVMETGLEGGFYTLVAMADGSTSLYFSTGGGILGGGEHERVREASRELLAVADRLASAAAPAAGTAPPGTGFTQFFLLTFEGLLSYSAPEVELGEQRDPLAPLFHAGHAVITQLRHVAP